MTVIREIFLFRDLLFMLTWRDIRIRYKQSALGLMWAILMPAAIILSGVVIRTALAKYSGKELAPEDLSKVIVKSVPWAFFVSSIRFGTNCMVGNSNLVTKIYFPKLVFPLSAVLTQLFDFMVAISVLAIVLAFSGISISVNLLWVPLLFLELIVLTTGVTIFLSAAGLFLRDVKYLVEIFVTFGIFVTPVLFDSALFGPWEPILLLNPVAPILEGLADCVVDRSIPNLPWLAYSMVVSTVLFLGAVGVFKRTEPLFAECI